MKPSFLACLGAFLCSGALLAGSAEAAGERKPTSPAADTAHSAKPAAAASKGASPQVSGPKASGAKASAAKASAPLQLHKRVAAPKPAQGAGKAAVATPAPRPAADEIAALIERHASDHGVPSALAHRVVMKESRYNPSARNRAYWGLMQIRHDTARSLGYSGPPEGLLDPDVNLRYGMAYLGNAYRVAGGDQSRAVALYSRGFYFEAKRKGMLGQMRKGSSEPVVEANAR